MRFASWKVKITFGLPGTPVREQGNGWFGCRRHSINKPARLSAQRRLNYQNWFQHKLRVTLQKHVYNKLAAHLTGCQWFSPTHFQLWVGWLCRRPHELVLHASWVACTPSHPPPARVTTFLELVHCKIKYELDGYSPWAKCPLPLIRTKIMILSVCFKCASLGEPLSRWTITWPQDRLKGEYNAEMISQIENSIRFIRTWK